MEFYEEPLPQGSIIKDLPLLDPFEDEEPECQYCDGRCEVKLYAEGINVGKVHYKVCRRCGRVQ